MDMRPPTDSELEGPNSLPQIILTSDLDWMPSSIDQEHDPEVWFDAMQDLPDLDYDLPFDEYGEYLHSHELAATYASIQSSFDLENRFIVDTCELIESTAEACQQSNSTIDFVSLQPQFGWLPTKVIENIFKHTTQFY